MDSLTTSPADFIIGNCDVANVIQSYTVVTADGLLVSGIDDLVVLDRDVAGKGLGITVHHDRSALVRAKRESLDRDEGGIAYFETVSIVIAEDIGFRVIRPLRSVRALAPPNVDLCADGLGAIRIDLRISTNIIRVTVGQIR